MNSPHPPLIWKTEAYDCKGNLIGTITKNTGGGIVVEGGSDAFALCLPDLRRAAAFFTNSDDLGRAAYEEFIRSDHPRATWEEMKANESQSFQINLWKRIAQAVLNTPIVTSILT